jgi:hypothetical protein
LGFFSDEMRNDPAAPLAPWRGQEKYTVKHLNNILEN